MCKEVVQCLGVGLCYACSPRGVKSNTFANIITRGGAMYRVRDCAAGKEPASACASRTQCRHKSPRELSVGYSSRFFIAKPGAYDDPLLRSMAAHEKSCTPSHRLSHHPQNYNIHCMTISHVVASERQAYSAMLSVSFSMISASSLRKMAASAP